VRSHRFVRYAKGAYHFLRHPASRETFTALSEALVEFRANREATGYMLRDPDVRALCTERYTGRPYTVDDLLVYPPGSLGHELGKAMKAQGYDPHFYRKFYGLEGPSFATDEEYLRFRVRQTHDILHVLTGFGMTAFPGELGMQAFSAAQTRRPFSVALVGLGMLRIVLRPEELAETLHEVARGFAMGFAARPLLAGRFEEGFARSVEEWRRELGIVDAEAAS
jgi:ubiquinone biosynthesis protein Coq4